MNLRSMGPRIRGGHHAQVRSWWRVPLLFLCLAVATPVMAQSDAEPDLYTFAWDYVEEKADAALRALFVNRKSTQETARATKLVAGLASRVLDELEKSIAVDLKEERITPEEAKKRSETLGRFEFDVPTDRYNFRIFQKAIRYFASVVDVAIPWAYPRDESVDGDANPNRRTIRAALCTLENWNFESVLNWSVDTDFGTCFEMRPEREGVQDKCRWYWCGNKCVPYCPVNVPSGDDVD